MSTRSDSPARRARPTLPASRLPAPLAALLLAALTAPAAAAADGIYRTVQADGTVVFSDRAAPDATLVEPRPLNVVDRGTGRTGDAAADGPDAGGDTSSSDEPTAARPPQASTGDPATDTGTSSAAVAPIARLAPVADVPIERVVIASPPPDVTIIDPAGPLLVEVGTAPGSLAASGLTVEALVDGEIVSTGTSSMIAVPALERGEHRLGIRLVDAGGTVVAASEEQALHVRRSIVERPNGEED